MIFLLIFIFSTYFPRPIFSRPRAPIFTGTISVLRPHILEISISIINSIYFESFSIVLTGDDDVDDDGDDEDDYYYVLFSSCYCSELRGASSFLESG